MPPQTFPHTALCCCCACARRRRDRRRRRFRIRFFTDEEEADLAAIAANSGRECGDFFRTLREPGNPERFLAGRPTLLAKVLSMSTLELLAASTTICARVPPPPARFRVQGIELSGFGFTRPELGRFPTAEAALAACADFRRRHAYPSLESCFVEEIATGRRL